MAVTSQQRASALLALPSELRNRIAQLVFETSPVSIISKDHDAPLLRTCKQLRQEDTTMWYALSTFEYNRLDDVIKWLSTLGKEKVALISELRTVGQGFKGREGNALHYLRNIDAILRDERLPVKSDVVRIWVSERGEGGEKEWGLVSLADLQGV